MERVMDQFDMLVTRVNEIGATQTQMKQQMDIRAAAMDEYTSEQHLIAQQVKANGAIVAQLTLQQFDQGEMYRDGAHLSPQRTVTIRLWRISLLPRNHHQRLVLPNIRNHHQSNQSTRMTKILNYPTTQCLRCNSPNLTELTQRFGKTTVRAILTSISCLKECG